MAGIQTCLIVILIIIIILYPITSCFDAVSLAKNKDGIWVRHENTRQKIFVLKINHRNENGIEKETWTVSEAWWHIGMPSASGSEGPRFKPQYRQKMY